MVTEKIILDMLTEESVSIIRQKVYIEGSETYDIGPQNRKALYNNEDGIKDAINELPEPHLTTLLTMWGKTELLKK